MKFRACSPAARRASGFAIAMSWALTSSGVDAWRTAGGCSTKRLKISGRPFAITGLPTARASMPLIPTMLFPSWSKMMSARAYSSSTVAWLIGANQ